MGNSKTVVWESMVLKVGNEINDIAIVYADDKTCGLYDLSTNKLIGQLGNYHTYIDYSRDIFYQVLTPKYNAMSSNLVNIKYIRIYDAKTKKMLADNWRITNIYIAHAYPFVVLESPDSKYHIFNLGFYNTPKCIFDIPFDNVELFRDHINQYLLVEYKGTKGLFNEKEGMVIPSIYDDIKLEGDIVIATKDSKKYWCHFDRIKDLENSFGFDEIYTEYDYVWGKNDKTTTLFHYYSNTEEIISTSSPVKITCDGPYAYCEFDYYTRVYFGKYELFTTDYKIIKHLTRYKTIFAVTDTYLCTKNGKLGVLRSEMSYKKTKRNTEESPINIKLDQILNCDYDKIEYNSEFSNHKQKFNIPYEQKVFDLHKKGKKGLLIINRSGVISTPTVYDKIEQLGNNWYAVYEQNICSLKHYLTNLKYSLGAINGCQLLEVTNEYILFKKDAKKGIIEHKYGTINFYDDIEFVDSNAIIIKNEGKVGFGIPEKIIPPEYDSIRCKKIKSEHGYDYYLDLENDNQHRIVKISNLGNKEDLEFGNKSIFKEVQFLENIIVLKDNRHTYIYNYNNELLETFKRNTVVTELFNEYINEYNYIINGFYYEFDDNYLMNARKVGVNETQITLTRKIKDIFKRKK